MRKLFARFSKKLLQNARRADIIMKLSWIYRLARHFTEVPISTWMHWLSCFFTYSRSCWFVWLAYLTGFLKNWITIVSLIFGGEHIRRGIEVVITGLTRNQFDGNVTWVRIPSSPPLSPLWFITVDFFYATKCSIIRTFDHFGSFGHIISCFFLICKR